MCLSVSGIVKDQIIARKIIESNDRFNEKGQLFIAQLKGHIDKKYINVFVNCPHIARNFTYTTDEKTIGKYMYETMKQCGTKTDKQERKLTNLLSIGRRYSRSDEIGIPFRITIDYASLDSDVEIKEEMNDEESGNESLSNQTVTIRERQYGLDQGASLSCSGCHHITRKIRIAQE
ncbi:MAG: hypothetical protein EZS28_022267 [Streblomastix strix]|uniref:Anticodon-binding domain-containing protein n=1 Tax=Streblomastix strix TaxID=222440 RepID=A0A5J4VHU3_9EUKA|nr:MAG: hypothetical protein EZS28_022267 [Streblomastix strix]